MKRLVILTLTFAALASTALAADKPERCAGRTCVVHLNAGPTARSWSSTSEIPARHTTSVNIYAGKHELPIVAAHGCHARFSNKLGTVLAAICQPGDSPLRVRYRTAKASRLTVIWRWSR